MLAKKRISCKVSQTLLCQIVHGILEEIAVANALEAGLFLAAKKTNQNLELGILKNLES